MRVLLFNGIDFDEKLEQTRKMLHYKIEKYSIKLNEWHRLQKCVKDVEDTAKLLSKYSDNRLAYILGQIFVTSERERLKQIGAYNKEPTIESF